MNDVRPVRLRLERRKGFNLQALSRATNGLEAIRCARPGRWGNPYRVTLFRAYSAADVVRDFKKWLGGDLGARVWAGQPPTKAEIKAALAGKNLACFCKLGEPCHADVLLALANPPAELASPTQPVAAEAPLTASQARDGE